MKRELHVRLNMEKVRTSYILFTALDFGKFCVDLPLKKNGWNDVLLEVDKLCSIRHCS